MARRKKKDSGGGGASWLVTFSDLMTLLLTFFVLLLSMASMDTTVITRISALNKSISPIPLSGPGREPERIRFMTEMIRDPDNILNKQRRLKDLLFPTEVLPPDLSFNELDKNLQILAHPEGVVIVLTDSLLFSPDSASLNNIGKKLLEQLTPVMHALNADINISGHSDAGGTGMTDGMFDSASRAEELSFLRAAAILEHFLQAQMRPERFSISGYGADKPAFSNLTDEGRRKNRRVEILVKTTPRVGSYT